MTDGMASFTTLILHDLNFFRLKPPSSMSLLNLYNSTLEHICMVHLQVKLLLVCIQYIHAHTCTCNMCMLHVLYMFTCTVHVYRITRSGGLFGSVFASWAISPADITTFVSVSGQEEMVEGQTYVDFTVQVCHLATELVK